MKKVNMTAVVNGIKSALTKRSPEILTGIGIAGMVTTTIFAVKATPKALMLIEDEKRKQNRENLKDSKEKGLEACRKIEKLKPIEVVKVSWKCYIPAALMCVSSIACLIGASSVHLKRNAALATAYKLSETALTEYKDKVVEVIGEKKASNIREKIVEDKIKNDPVKNSQVIITGGGDTLCYDCLGGRYFKSSMDKIKKAENEINRLMLRDMYVSLNEFYDELGLDHTTLGDDLGWNMDDGLIEFNFSSHLAEDGTPCLAIDYNVAPNYNYSTFC